MDKKRIAVLSTLLAFALAGAVVAGTTMTTRGDIAAVDAKMSRLTVNAPKGEAIVFQINEKTTILRDGEKIELTDIAVGDKAIVNYEQAEDTKVAVAIGIERKAA